MARFCGREDQRRWSLRLSHHNSNNFFLIIYEPCITRPPYCRIGAGSTLPVTSAMSSFTLIPNSWMYGSRLKLAFFICEEWRTSIISLINHRVLLCGLHPLVISTTHQPADLLLSVGRGASCGFDHSGGLIICQFLDASLTCYNVTNLEQVNPESLGCEHRLFTCTNPGRISVYKVLLDMNTLYWLDLQMKINSAVVSQLNHPRTLPHLQGQVGVLLLLSHL